MSSTCVSMCRPPLAPPPPPIQPRHRRAPPFAGTKVVGASIRGSDRYRAPALYKGLEPLYDDGHGTVGLKDYVDAAIGLVKYAGGGSPRWFCPAGCGPPIVNAPVLLFLPDLDGIGMGLFLHHKALGRIFEIRCMHIPAYDRTPFEELVKLVENVVRAEQSLSGNKPIYLMGHSFGGSLALSVAARNPKLDLVLILSNPATAFNCSKILSLFPFMKNISHQINLILPYLLSTNIGNQLRKVLGVAENGHHLLDIIEKHSKTFSHHSFISSLLGTMSGDALQWKVMLLKAATDCANASLHAITAEVLLLDSSQGSLLPNSNEAKRLSMLLSNCRIHRFKDHGYNLLLESGINLLTIIKGISLYRHSGKHDYISDYIPPTSEEQRAVYASNRLLFWCTSPVIVSTTESGKIVKGLSGIPNEGPVLLVGNHMLLGAEAMILVAEFLREKRAVLRGLSHPVLFPSKTQNLLQWHDFYILANVFGALPVSRLNLYRLFSEKSFVLMYPGGAREALHRKGEEYKLIWPHQTEFIRMATRFGATIVPFGTVGEDDMVDQLLDYDDIMRVPLVRDGIHAFNRGLNIDAITGERRQQLLAPLIVPKVPGRLYFRFGKPISTAGLSGLLRDREGARDLYQHVKSEVESCISYLMAKREEDKYRSIFQRGLYQAIWGSSHPIPSFDP